MGVNSLWKVLEPIKQSKSLLLFAEEHRLRANSAGITGANATLKIGIDMGTCMAECNAGALAAGVHNQRAGAGLYIFFKKLTEFIKVPVALVFVLDGPGRPHLKRGHKVRPYPIWWINLAAALVEAFGYAIHRAPGEAEAELAKLSMEGHIDAVITSDSDAYLFGARVILRSIPNKEKNYSDEYALYDIDEGHPLTQDGLILFALLSGGDYNSGIKNCGRAIALGLAKCGFGEQLIAAFRCLEHADFEDYLIQWRCAMRTELNSNSRGLLPRRQPSLSMAIPDEFPSLQVLRLYVNPLTSWSPGRIPPNVNQWRYTQPQLPTIARFCSRHFFWTNALRIKEKFGSYLWEGMVLQALYSPSTVYNPAEKQLQLPGLSRAVDVFEMSYQKRRGQYAQVFGSEPQPKLVVSTAVFNRSMGFKFAASLSKGKITVWPRASLLPQALRQQLEEKKVRNNRSNNIVAAASAAPLQPLPQSSNNVAANISSSSTGTAGEWHQLAPEHWFIDLSLDANDAPAAQQSFAAGEWLQLSPNSWFCDLSSVDDN